MHAAKVCGLGAQVRRTWSSCARRASGVPAPEPAVIRVPRPVRERVSTVRQVRRADLGKVCTARPGRMLITCRNPQFDQSARYTLGRFEEPLLASKGWKSSKSFGDYFAINGTQTAGAFFPEPGPEGARDGRTFSSLHLCADLVTDLQARGLTRPTTVQVRTIPKLLQGHSVLCAAETGSGKTLAYLLPIIHRLRAGAGPEGAGPERAGRHGVWHEGAVHERAGRHKAWCEGSWPEGAWPEDAQRTRAVVLVPSRELAEQVASVAKVTSRPFGLKVRVVGGGRGVASIKAAFVRGPPDVLVATPGALLKALRRRYVDLGDLEFLVVDEADTMLDASFSAPLERILTQTRISETPGRAQLVVVGATFPGGLEELLGKATDTETLVTVRSPNLHLLMPHVHQTFIKVRGSEKVPELHRALKEAERERRGALVFCNSASTVNWLGYALEEMGTRHARLQGEMPASLRDGIFRSYQRGHVDVLVCTDVASRGLDTQRVGLVVNYDFPESYADYIHRAGRVGRAGGPGGARVLSFVTHPWDVELVQGIETAARRRTCLPGLEKGTRAPVPKTSTRGSR